MALAGTDQEDMEMDEGEEDGDEMMDMEEETDIVGPILEKISPEEEQELDNILEKIPTGAETNRLEYMTDSLVVSLID